MSPRCTGVLVATLVIMSMGYISPGVAAASRGEGTMQVHRSEDCSGNGNASVVSLPFSALFTGFPPDATGPVTAFAQPGNVTWGRRR